MNVYSLLPDPKLAELFAAILQSGGLIHGGCLRDLFFYQEYAFKDIDVYYDQNSVLAKSVKTFNSMIIDKLFSFVKEKPSFSSVKNLHWLDSPLDDYGYELSHYEIGVPCPGYRTIELEIDAVVLDLIYRTQEFTAKNNFLDFDINSLYLLPDGTISSSLGSDKVDRIISRIKEGQCKLMRADVPDDRIKHIIDKGFSCNLVPFL